MPLVKIGERLPLLNSDHILYVEDLPAAEGGPGVKVHFVGGGEWTMRGPDGGAWTSGLIKQAKDVTKTPPSLRDR